jgi:membrane associated rhomboid family serine protease
VTRGSPDADFTAILKGTPDMRALEIIVGLIVAAVLFVVLEVIGIVIKFALIAAAAGFVAGVAVTMMFRSKSS